MNRFLANLGRRGRAREQEAAVDAYGPLSQAELLSAASVPLDSALLRAAVHVMRAEGARAQKSLAGAGKNGLTDSQVREECGALAAAGRIEAALVGLVAEANRKRGAA